MRLPFRRRNKSRGSNPRGGGAPFSKNARDAFNAAVVASPPSLRAFRSPPNPWRLSWTPESSAERSAYAAAAAVCAASLAKDLRWWSKDGSSPPGRLGSGAEYSAYASSSSSSSSSTRLKSTPIRAAAFTAASFGSNASFVSMSSSSIVMDPPPPSLAASAAMARLRPRFFFFVSSIATSSSSSPSPYRPRPLAPRHRSLPRGGIAISLRHDRNSSILRMTPTLEISVPGRRMRTAL
mmetsp:Transcript_14237/g.39121  ORF Transcript_14237/g.39121 Transcript_14237/m.39121 type:complete len:237 (-) Transcript_14237:1923-2633(-)